MISNEILQSIENEADCIADFLADYISCVLRKCAFELHEALLEEEFEAFIDEVSLSSDSTLNGSSGSA